nr:hypothetical protein [Micromonospora sp. AMSO31t]
MHPFLPRRRTALLAAASAAALVAGAVGTVTAAAAATGCRAGYSTPVTTGLRLPTLMHDPQYRVAVAWQNTAYNQPPHPGFQLGDGMSTPPAPNIYLR